MILFSIVASVLLTVVLNLLLRWARGAWDLAAATWPGACPHAAPTARA